jgi:RHS repeat-associated protein
MTLLVQRRSSLLVRAIARLLIPVLILSLVPALPAQASFPRTYKTPTPGLPLLDARELRPLALALFLAERNSGHEGRAILLVAGLKTGASNVAPAIVAILLCDASLRAETELGSKYNRARWMDPSVGRWTALDPIKGDMLVPRTQHGYAYAVNDPLNAMDPSGLFAESAFGVTGLITTLAVQAQLPLQGILRTVTARLPIGVATEIMIQEDSKWSDAAALQVFAEAQAIWADEAGIFMRISAVRRIPNSRLVYSIPAFDDRFVPAKRYLDGFAQRNHVTMLCEERFGVGGDVVGAFVDGRASLKRDPSSNRAYTFVWSLNGRVLAHEWGHTFGLKDNEDDGRQHLMRQGGWGTEITEPQVERTREYAKTF